MKRREEMSFSERIYIPEICRGLTVTFGKLLNNFFLHLLHAIGIKQALPASVSIQYPNQRRAYPSRYRGRHRLTIHSSGEVKCTSCFLCATACPAKCIYIEPMEHKNPSIEKFPHRYEIDTLLCIYCGYCVEACPVDAIRMDTGIHPEVYSPNPRLFVEDKEILMERSYLLEKYGQDTLFEEHMKQIQELETRPFAKAK